MNHMTDLLEERYWICPECDSKMRECDEYCTNCDYHPEDNSSINRDVL